MAFMLRRPFALTSALKQAPKASSATIRAFHNTPLKSAPKSFFTARTAAPSLAESNNVFRNTFRAFRRNYSQQSATTSNPEFRQRLIYGAGIFGGTLLAINLIFNRETREDGGMPPHERSYLNDTFLHTGLGVGIIALAARTLHFNGWSYRLMSANPWLVLGLGLVGSVGSMYGCMATRPDNYVQKYALWGLFNLTQAALLSPLMFMHPALLARAGLYTVGMMGSIAFVGATAKQEKYLYLGGPLLAGVAIVALSGLAPMVLPATAARTLMWTENIWLYGGLAVFGGFTLYDVQKVLHHARLSERGLMQRDAVNESISLELDFINIFVRMVQILGMQQRRK
ncbi:Growth hormone-inducible transmembrane protein [Lasiodiplodia hormozganensis]|uniref:Growth hormone-inducible transmembrane protein n=2 Tax=Lasiodiplodia TaxID=66739 RepID=A0A5N5DNL3_9PEZI|nr:Bax inhibitor family protein [Lasiodiplodia theobromae]KAB2579337.1 Growth hormone-inducible transmembrane protein [Lasiodiplodia theobromae]KAF4542092.1 Bax inhibitor family protein [Lasiodiplodia theobromae]KAK0664705.1 Growth hormone-inducible transmembrane protein [Lasiodiplodia hormozganensis]